MADYRSLVWNFFIRENSTDCKCKTCSKIIKAPKGNTSNLVQHLKNKHSLTTYKDYQDMKDNAERIKKTAIPSTSTQQTNIKDLFQSKIKWDKSHPKAKAVTRKIVQMICIDHLPLNTVESTSFANVIAELEPRYQLPSRKTLSSELIPQLYQEIKTKICGGLENVNSIAFTADGWTSRAVDSYISLTAHYLSAESSLTIESKCLAVRNMPESHTSDNLEVIFMDLFQEWNININAIPLFIITDNARNFRNAVNRLIFLQSIPCVGHTLQLVVTDMLSSAPGLKALLAKARAICGHFHRSTTAKAKLTEFQIQLNLSQHKLKTDCATRWNSTYFMCERLIEQQQAITLVISNTESVNNLTAFEWRTMKDLIILLKPLEEATRMLSGDKYPAAAVVIPLLNGLKNIYNKQLGGLNDLRKKILDSLKSHFQNYEENEIFSIATIVDCRFKTIAFSSQEACEIAKHRLIEMMKKNMSLCPTKLTSQETEVQHEDSLWSFFDDNVKKAKITSSPVDIRLEMELKDYLLEPVLERSKSSINWWSISGQNKYPNIFKVALQYLNIPATSVSSERLFSVSGDIINELRTKLTPERAEQLIFLATNL